MDENIVAVITGALLLTFWGQIFNDASWLILWARPWTPPCSWSAPCMAAMLASVDERVCGRGNGDGFVKKFDLCQKLESATNHLMIAVETFSKTQLVFTKHLVVAAQRFFRQPSLKGQIIKIKIKNIERLLKWTGLHLCSNPASPFCFIRQHQGSLPSDQGWWEAF